MQRLVGGANPRAYLFSVCSARLLSVLIVGYTVGCWRRYDNVQTNLARIQDATRLHIALEARWGERSDILLPIASLRLVGILPSSLHHHLREIPV